MIFLKKKFKNFDYRKLKKLNLHTPKISDYSSHIAKKKYKRYFKKIQKDFSKKIENVVLKVETFQLKFCQNQTLNFILL